MDSGSAAIGGGILVELALQYLDAGMTAQEIAAKLEKNRDCRVGRHFGLPQDGWSCI